MSNRKLRTITISATMQHEARGLTARLGRRKRPAMSTAARLRLPSPPARAPGKVHTRADASIVRRPAPGGSGGWPISPRLESRSRAQHCYR
jgi:hypothetical protein